ncbi:hypothetical protein Bca101_083431 [Brassica carinata]
MDEKTATYLSVAFLDQEKRRPLSLYRWLSETKNNGDCCGSGESKGGLMKRHDPGSSNKRPTIVHTNTNGGGGSENGGDDDKNGEALMV